MLLIVEDQDTLRKGIVNALRELGYDVDEASDGNEAFSKLKRTVYDLIVTDLKMPGPGGMEILKEVKKDNPSTVVIIMTAYGSVDTAVEAMKEGACDFVQKPFPLEELEIKVNKALERRQLETTVSTMRAETPYRPENIVGESGKLKDILAVVNKIAKSNASVFIDGETGTGKEVIAGAIHYSSQRSSGPFVKINCAAIPENLLESELFGHEKGAFTSADRQHIGRFERAHRGTIFLDEIGDMNLSTQAKILRVLQEQEFERVGGTKTLKVDVRIIAATNKDLNHLIEEGKFREDLFYRISVVPLHMPPLRERKEDIMPLANHFLGIFSRELGKKIAGFGEDASHVLCQAPWLGNVRELKNTIERAVLMADGDMVKGSDIVVHERRRTERADSSPYLSAAAPVAGSSLDEAEKNLILDALRKNDWVQKDAAKMLGISRRVINYKINIYGISHPRWKKNR